MSFLLLFHIYYNIIRKLLVFIFKLLIFKSNSKISISINIYSTSVLSSIRNLSIFFLQNEKYIKLWKYLKKIIQNLNMILVSKYVYKRCKFNDF